MSVPNPHRESRPWKNQALKTCNPQIALETIDEVLEAEKKCRENGEDFLPAVVHNSEAAHHVVDEFQRKREADRAAGRSIVWPAPDEPGIVYIYFDRNSKTPRRFIVPPDDPPHDGNPIPHLRELEVGSRTRLKNDENPCWYFRVHHQFKQKVDPNSGVSFADYCEQLFSDRIESLPSKSIERDVVNIQSLPSKSATVYTDQERINELFDYVQEFRDAIRSFRDQGKNFHALDRPDVLQSPPPVSPAMQSLMDSDKRRNPKKVVSSTIRCWGPKWNEDIVITTAREKIVGSLIDLVQSWLKIQNALQIMSERDPVHLAKFSGAFLRLQCALEILTDGSNLFHTGGDLVRDTIRLFEDSFILADRRESDRIWRDLQRAIPRTSEKHLDLALLEFEGVSQQDFRTDANPSTSQRKAGRPSGPRNQDEAEAWKRDELLANQWREFEVFCDSIKKRPLRALFAMKIGMAGREDEIKEAIRRHKSRTQPRNETT